MRLEFRYTAEDFRALHRARARTRWFRSSSGNDVSDWLRIIVGPVCVVLLAANAWHDHPRATPSMLIGATCAAAYVLFTLVAVVQKIRATRKLRRLIAEMGQRVLEIDERGIARVLASGTHRYRWDEFDRTLSMPAHCFVRYTDQPKKWLVIPLRGLVNPSHAAALQELLHRHVEPATHGFPVLPIEPNINNVSDL